MKTDFFKKVPFTLFLLAAYLSAYSSIYYVTTSGAGSKNGSSWSNAYDATQLRTALLNLSLIP